MIEISQRIEKVQTPIIPEVADLINENPGTISLGQGVVFYKPPAEIANGLSKFTSLNSHHYEAVEGIPELRRLIHEKLELENGINSEQYQIVVSAGSNMGFLNAILAICDSGDEVILLRPWYFNHEMAIGIADCTAVSVETDENFHPDLNAIQRAITPKTRAIATVSPNNPTGAVYSKESLNKINQLCSENGIYHIHDEAYEYFCYGDANHYSPASAEAAREHTISLFSTSKSFGLANWRIGYSLIPNHLFKPIRKIQDTNLICPPVVSQYVAAECLKLGRKYCDAKVREIAEVRKHFAHSLTTISSIESCALEGAFYGFLNIPEIGMSDMEIIEYLICRHKVAVIPGVAFGIENRCCIRVSYGALQPSTAVEGINRLMDGLNDLLNAQ